MSNDKIKAIGRITLVNSAVIGQLASCITLTLENVLPLLPEKDDAIGLLHNLEQLQAALRDLKPALDLARVQIEAD